MQPAKPWATLVMSERTFDKMLPIRPEAVQMRVRPLGEHLVRRNAWKGDLCSLSLSSKDLSLLERWQVLEDSKVSARRNGSERRNSFFWMWLKLFINS